ncbi:MAG: hypothetical protein ABFC94_14780 [Syntrophomonas sp.]
MVIKLKFKIFSIICALVCISCSTPQSLNNTGQMNTGTLCLSIPYGTATSELGVIISGIEKEGPKSFFAQGDYFYILDSVKKRIAIFADGEFYRAVSINNCSYPLDLLVFQERFFVYDNPDQPTVYEIDLNGQILNQFAVTIPGHETKWLSLTRNNHVAVIDCNYNEYELDPPTNKFKKGKKGISTVFNNNAYWIQKTQDGKLHLLSLESSIDIPIESEGITTGVEIIGYDLEGNIYVIANDMANTSKVTGEFTARKFDRFGNPSGSAVIPISDYYYMPVRMAQITPDGTVYLMVSGENSLEIRKLVLNK